MGMFDYVTNVSVPCPKCGKILNNFQSKDLRCNLDSIHFSLFDYFYDLCDCGKEVTFKIKRESRKNKARKDLTLDDYDMSW